MEPRLYLLGVAAAATLGCGSAQWTHSDDLVITHPTSTSSFATGDAVLIQWVSNPAAVNLSTFQLNLYAPNSATIVSVIAASVDTASGQFLYTFPGTLSAGRYWFGGTTDSTLRGYGPYPNNGNLGSLSVAVTVGSSCANHNQCLQTEYCDRNSICAVCDECTRWYDAIDFACPSKCGGDPTFVVGSTIPAATEMDTVGTLDDFVTPACPAFARLVNSTDPLLSFGPATSTAIPSLMTTRLRDKLSVLAATVALDTRFNGLRVHVVSAYEFPPASGTNATLHHAGQAARLNVVNVASPGTAVASIFLQHLGRLAAFAGLDWVHYADASYLYVSVIPDGCRTALDLALVLDGSGSIELTRHGGAPGNFANRVLGFAKALVPHLTFGTTPNASQMAIVTFASSATLNFDLNDHHDPASLLAAIDAIPYPEGGTSTALGLRMVRTEIFTEARGMRPNSAGVPRVTIVITDGQSSSGQGPSGEAALLKADPVNSAVISIGVGTGYSLAELNVMASTPVSQNVFTLKSFARVPYIVDKISFTACQSRSIIDSGVSTIGEASECEFVFFRSQCGHLPTSVIEVTATTGSVHVYVGTSTRPGPFRYLVRDESDAVLKSLFVSRATGDTTPLYIGVKGVGSGLNRFSVRVWSNVFSGSTTPTLSVSETATVGSVLHQPTATGITWTLLPMTDGTIPPFSVSPSTGVITLNASLDYEARSTYTLRVTAVNNALDCQNGLQVFTVNVTDVNDVVPSFPDGPYTASLAINAPAGFVVLRPSALDTDGPPLVYGISVSSARRGRRAPGDNDLTIDPATGVVTTTVLIDGTTTTYNLTITATDGVFTGQTTASVTVAPCEVCAPGLIELATCSGGTTAVVCGTTTTRAPTTLAPTTLSPTTVAPTTQTPTTPAPVTASPVAAPVDSPTTVAPVTAAPTTAVPTSVSPTTLAPTTGAPTTAAPTTTTAPTTVAPTTVAPTTLAPTTLAPVSAAPVVVATAHPAAAPTTPTSAAPATAAPTTATPTTLAPSTVAPTTVAPTTPSPTLAAPTASLAPTVSLAPTSTAPSVADTNNQESAGGDGGGDASWLPALAVLLLLLLAAAFFVARRRQEKVDTADTAVNPMYGSWRSGTALSPAAFALPDGRNPQWNTFRQVVAFDATYYGNPALTLDNAALKDAYAELRLRHPNEATLGKLREVGEAFLGSTVPKTGEDRLDDLVDFLWSTVADEAVERAIDAVARQRVKDNRAVPPRGLSEARVLQLCLADLTAEYQPETNEFLVPVKSDPSLRQLPPRLRHPTDPDYMEPTMAGDNIYTLGNNDDFAVYAIANVSESKRYRAPPNPYATPTDGDALYSLGDNDHAAPIYAESDGAGGPTYWMGASKHGGGDPVYAAGDGRDSPPAEPLYAMGNNAVPENGPRYAAGGPAAEPLYAMGDSNPGAAAEPLYAMGDAHGADSDPVYAMGDNNHSAAAAATKASRTSNNDNYRQAAAEPLYAMGESEEPLYAEGTGNFDPAPGDEPLYALGANNAGQPAALADEPLYTLGTAVPDNVYAVGNNNNPEALYETASPTTSATKASPQKAKRLSTGSAAPSEVVFFSSPEQTPTQTQTRPAQPKQKGNKAKRASTQDIAVSREASEVVLNMSNVASAGGLVPAFAFAPVKSSTHQSPGKQQKPKNNKRRKSKDDKAAKSDLKVGRQMVFPQGKALEADAVAMVYDGDGYLVND